MGFKERLKEARLLNNMTQEQIAEKIGVAKSTFTGYEKGNSEPNMYTVSKIMKALNVDANFLWQDDCDFPMQVSYDEMQYIKKYRSLDKPGKSHVDTVLVWETDRIKQIKQASSTAAIIELQDGTNEKRRLIEYFRSVSAGSGQVIFDDVYSERIMMPDIPEYRRVAYAVKVNGKSMEPLYNDGDILLIEPTCEIETNEIGIFNVNGQAYVKKLGKGKLISLNKGYDDVPLTEDSLCMGRVVGKL